MHMYIVYVCVSIYIYAYVYIYTYKYVYTYSCLPMQARGFNAAVGVTGIVLTKLDGTSKGGVVVSMREIEREKERER